MRCTVWGSVAGTFTGVDEPGQQARHLGLSSNLHKDGARRSTPGKTASACSLRASPCSVLMWASFNRRTHARERLRASADCSPQC